MWCCEAVGCRLYLQAPGHFSERIVRLLGPFVTAEPVASATDGEWRVIAAENERAGPDFEIVTVTPRGEPPTTLWIARERRVLVIPCQLADALVIQNAVRYVRIILRLMSASRGGIFLHAGLVRGDKGVALLGGKRAGKTSAALALMQAGNAFVSNDDLSLHSCHGNWLGHGWPRAVSVRADTLAAVGLAERDRSGGGAASPRHPGRPGPDRLLLYPHELAELTGAPLVRRARLDRLVFTGFHDGPPTLRSLPADEAAARLRTNVVVNPVRHADFLLPSFPLVAAGPADDLLREICRQAPGFELRQNFACLRHGASLLHTLLREESS